MQTNKQQPAFEIVNDKIQQTGHSLSADLAMGWRPKLKVIGPIPLNFDNPFIDKSIKQILKSQASIYSVIYLGPRPLNTFKMHQVLKKKYKYKYQHLFSVEYGHLKAFFHKFYSQFEPKMKMPFLGMNPLYKTQKLTFDSCFESGNLDCVVKVGDNEYDLILRIDSNTAGHIMWYYFKVTNNDNKNQRGMKPFIRKKKRNLIENKIIQEWTQWQQGGINVEVTQQKLRYAKQTIVFNAGMIGVQQPPVIFRRLSFQIEFQPFEEMQFAYCVPYTYSDVISDIKQWKQSITDHGMKNVHFAVDMSNQSLSGLEIPFIKITEKQTQKYDEESQKNKQSVFIIGRQHPGESNDSWVMKGLISQLIDDSPQIRFLRKHIVFTIIPMLNVDGVVMGNFRTSLYGKDLNRLFRKQQLFLIPEVEMCKEQFNQLLKVFKTKIMLFLDVHGHSARRNAFCYGPGILDSNAFNDVREFAKIIASKTQIFRYPSCSFRIQHDKKTTARGCFSKSVRLAYTIQASNWSFYSRSLGTMIDFTSQYWQSIGIDMVNSLCEYAQDKIIKTKGKAMKNKNKNNQKNTVSKINEKRSIVVRQGQQMSLIKSQVMINERQSPQRKRIKRAQTTRQIAGKVAERNEQKINSQTKNHNKTHTDKLRPPSHSTSQYQQSLIQRQKISKSSKYIKMQQIQQEQNQSDKYSDNEMDSDSQGQDMQKSKFQRYMNGAKRMMIQFQKVYLGDQYEKKGRTAVKVRQEKARLAGRESKNVRKNSQVLACLRKKQPIQQQQQPLEINSSTRLAQNPKSKPLSQLHRKPNQTSLPLNTKQIQFQYQHQQQQPIARQIMLINHKAQYQKILLPRIQQSYQLRRKRQYLQEVNVGQGSNHKQLDDNDDRQYQRLQEWTYGQMTPQLAENNDDCEDQQSQRYRYNNNNFNKRINFNNNKRLAQIHRHKSITNYDRHQKRNNHVDFYKNNQQINQRHVRDNNNKIYQDYDNKQQGTDQQQYKLYQQQQQQKNDEDKFKNNARKRYEEIFKRYDDQQQQYSNLQQLTKNNNNMINIQSIQKTTSRQNQNNVIVEQQTNNIPILRYSMKLQSPTTYHHTNHISSSSNNNKQSMLARTKRQLQQIKRMQLIQKLSDPISKGYVDIIQQGGNNSNGVNKKYKQNDKQMKQQQIDKLTSSSQRKRISSNNYNNNKIKQIILNNLQQSSNNSSNNSNRKSYARTTKRQKPKVVIEQKQQKQQRQQRQQKQQKQQKQQRQKFSIQPIIMYKVKGQDIKGHELIRDSIMIKNNNMNKLIPSSPSISISPQRQNTINKNNSNLLFYQQQQLYTQKYGQSSIISSQQMISVSVILPRTNINNIKHQQGMLQKIKTLQSQNLNVVFKADNNKQNNNVDMIIKQQYKLNNHNLNNSNNNNKVIKYGYESLPKLEQDKRQKTSSIHKHMSRTKINSLHKNVQRQSPLKTTDKMKKLNPMATSGVQNESKQQKDQLMMRNINLVIKNGNGQQHEQQREYHANNINNINNKKNNNNKQALITRLKQLQQQQTNQQFTQDNLLQPNNNNNNKQSSQQYKQRYDQISVTRKQMKIFSLPVNVNVNVNVNNNSKFTISNGSSGLGSLNINSNSNKKQQFL